MNSNLHTKAKSEKLSKIIKKRSYLLTVNLNLFVPNATFLYPLKTSENCNVF